MLQVAFAGYYLADNNISEYVESPVYYEPGFNIMSPLEIAGYITDRIYMLVRKRSDDTGTVFENITASNLEIVSTDATNGETVPSLLRPNNINNAWNDNPSYLLPVVAQIDNAVDLSNPVTRVRVVDCNIKDTRDGDFISFRLIIDDEDKYFHYIPVEVNSLANRNTYTAVGRNVYVRIASASDYYIIFSPYAYLIEDSESNSNFSYPLNSIFYRRQNTYNNEDYSFSISSYSHSFVPELVSVLNVPFYSKVGVVIVDKMFYKYLVDAGEIAYINIAVSGQLSNISDIFTINFMT